MNRLSCLVALPLLAACAAPLPYGETIPRPLVMGPYVVTPPPSKWHPAPGAVGATYVHEESNALHTMAIRVLPVVPPDDLRDAQKFIDTAKRYNADRLDPDKQQVIQESYAPVTVNGLACIAYEVDGADRGIKQGASTPFVIVGQLCRHPWHPDWIDVSFAERGGEGGVRPDVREAGAKVLASLRALEPR